MFILQNMFRQIPNTANQCPFETITKLFESDPEFLGNIGKTIESFVSVNKEKEKEDHPMQQLFGSLLDKITTAVPQEGVPPTYEYEITESYKDLTVCIDMPGVDKESMLVSYECLAGADGKKTLNITGERKQYNADDTVVVKSSVHYGKRALSLLLKKASQSVTSEDITAKYENGVLTISVPKANEDIQKQHTKYVEIA